MSEVIHTPTRSEARIDTQVPENDIPKQQPDGHRKMGILKISTAMESQCSLLTGRGRLNRGLSSFTSVLLECRPQVLRGCLLEQRETSHLPRHLAATLARLEDGENTVPPSQAWISMPTLHQPPDDRHSTCPFNSSSWH